MHGTGVKKIATFNISEFGVCLYTYIQLFPFICIKGPLHATVNWTTYLYTALLQINLHSINIKHKTPLNLSKCNLHVIRHFNCNTVNAHPKTSKTKTANRA